MAYITSKEEHVASSLLRSAELYNMRPAVTLRGAPTKVSAAACARLRCAS